MAEKKAKEKPTLTMLGEMKVGDKLWFPAAKLNSIKAMCSNFGFQWNKTFATSIDRQTNGLYVTRTR